MRVLYHIKQLGLISWKTEKLDSFLRMGEAVKHVESILSIQYRDRVAHCFKLAMHNVP